jgi:hypothetical protein
LWAVGGNDLAAPEGCAGRRSVYCYWKIAWMAASIASIGVWEEI